MSILSTNQKLISLGQEYSAGENIGIYDRTISSRNWSPDITFAAESAFLKATDYTNTQISGLSSEVSDAFSAVGSDIDKLNGDVAYISGVALTAHQSLDGYATEDWVTAQGYITGVDLSPYYTTAEANSLSSMLSGAIDYVSANADNVEVTNVVQSNSGTWNEVTNKLDTTAFSDVSGSFYTNDNPSGFITGVDLSNYYTKDETSGKEELAQAFADIPVGDPEVNAYVTNNSATLNGTTDLVQNSSGLWNDVAVYQSNSAKYLTAHQDISYKLDESAFADVSGTFLTAINIPESAGWEEATQAYEENSGTYLTAHQSLDGYATEDWVTGQGYITGVEIPESATWNEVSTTVQTNSSNWDNVTNKLDTTAFSDVSGTFLTAHQDLSDYQTIEGMTAYQEAGDYASASDLENYQPVSSMTAYQPIGDYVQGSDIELNSYNKISAISGHELAGGGGGNPEVENYVVTNSAQIDDTVNNVTTNSGVWGGSALPISAGPGIKFEMVDNTLVASTSGYIWQSASLFHTDSPVTQTNYTLSDNCSNYDKLEVDFYDINNWRTQMDCPIPPNLASSGTRGGYFSVVPASTATGANVWFKAFNWTAANTTWTCYCSEIAAQGGSTTQTVNANQPDNPPKVVNIIGWKRIGG